MFFHSDTESLSAEHAFRLAQWETPFTRMNILMVCRGLLQWKQKQKSPSIGNVPSLIFRMDSETPSSLPQTPSSFDSLFSSPSPDLLQSPISTRSMLSNLRTSRSIPSRRSRLSSMCSLTSCWILSSSEIILSLVFPIKFKDKLLLVQKVQFWLQSASQSWAHQGLWWRCRVSALCVQAPSGCRW